MGNKLRKVSAAALSVVLVAAMVLTGTLAWRSISQQALNEAEVVSNPGGRLHDDFNGTNKDVYVENFGDEIIFARIRLDEYLEIGDDAGIKNAEPGTKDVTVLGTGKNGVIPDIDDPSTWATHIPSGIVQNCDDPFHEYWTWEMGGSTVYMPTFNMNKDSLEADINGTFANSTVDADNDGAFEPYEDYVDYNQVPSLKGFEIWDNDNNADDELKTAGVNIKDVIAMDQSAVNDVKNTYSNSVNLSKGTDVDGDNEPDGMEHTAKQTLSATVITMAQWVEQGCPIGNYWVYDTDGWAYWAAPIQPGTATGLLLSGIEKNRHTEHSYYGINVVAQFATAGDWGAAGEDGAAGSGFFADGMTPEGLTLLNTVADLVPRVTGLSILNEGNAVTGNITVNPDEVLNLSALVSVMNAAEGVDLTDVEWSISPSVSDGVFSDGVFAPTETEANNTYTITVTSKYNSGISSSYEDVTASVTVTVQPPHPFKNIAEGDLVTVDDIDWYVLKIDEENNRVLLWAAEFVHTTVFGTSNSWETSEARRWLNDEFLDKLNILKPIETEINTRTQYNDATPNQTKDKVFLLSEADVFGTVNGNTTDLQATDYTVPGVQLVEAGSSMLPAPNTFWLRSPSTTTTYVASIVSDGSSSYSSLNNIFGLRPAMWISIPA